MDLKKIKPQNIKKSDKYSKGIYKYLKDNKWYRRVWYDESFYESGSDQYVRRPFNVDNMDLRNMYIGMPDSDSFYIIGKCINSIIAGGRGSQESFCYTCYKNAHFVDVTEEFFEKYIEIGRCIYGHGRYLADEETRYAYIDPTHRRCNWCGKEQEEVEITREYKHKEWR